MQNQNVGRAGYSAGPEENGLHVSLLASGGCQQPLAWRQRISVSASVLMWFSPHVSVSSPFLPLMRTCH